MNVLLQLLDWLKLPCASLCISLAVFDVIKSADGMTTPSHLRMTICFVSSLLWLMCTIACWILED